MPENYSKCACANCGGHIEFPTQGAGTTVPCPHCAWPTLLTVPQNAKSSRDPQGPPAAPGAARPINRRKQILLLAAVGAIFIAAAALCLVRYFPNVIRPLLTASSGAKRSDHESRQISPPPVTNRSAANVASTNQNARPPATLAASSPPPDPWQGLTCGAIALEKSKDSTLVYGVGQLRNTADHQRFGVKVVLDLFDQNNHKVGSATDYTQWIDSGKEWRFKAMITERTAVRAELASVTEQ